MPRRSAALPAATFTKPDTKVACLLQLLDNLGDMTSAELAHEIGLPTRLVWGLMKQPRERGQVSFDGGHWSLDRSYPGSDVLRAIDLLRSRGYRVIEPAQ